MAKAIARENNPRQDATKLIAIGFSIVIALMLALAVSTLVHIERMHESVREITEGHTVNTRLSHRMFNIARERVYLLFNIVHADDLFLADELALRFRALEQEFGLTRQELLKQHLDPEEVALLEIQRQAAADTLQRQELFLDLVFAGKKQQAETTLITQVLPAQESVLTALGQVIDVQNRKVVAAGMVAAEHERQARLILPVGTAVATLLSVLIAFYVRANMSRLMQGLAEKSEQLRLSLRDLEFQKKALDDHAIVSIADHQGRIVYVNDRFCEVSRYTRQELIGQDHHVVNSGQHPKQFFHDMWRTIAGGNVWHGHVCNRSKDGSFYWVDTTIRPFIGDNGRPEQYVSIRTEITAIKEAEALLKSGKEEQEALVAQRTAELGEREAVLQRITGAAQDAIVMIDHQDRVTFWNAAAEKLFGYTREEILGRLLHPLLMPVEMQARQSAAFSRFVATGKGDKLDRTTELAARHRDGSEFPIDLSLSAVQIKGNWCGIGIVRDVSVRKQAEAALQLLADTDTLTRLPNRRKFDAILLQEVGRTQRHGTPLTLVMLDVDHFKAVNDSSGHQVGDAVLVELARLVSAHIRTYDIFARWGGEEFVILASHSDRDATLHFADKLRSLVAEHEFPGVGHVTISLGLSAYRASDSIETLLARADTALYRAKAGGRNRVEYE